MSTIGWLFILTALLLIRAVAKNQVFDNDGNFVLFDYATETLNAYITGDKAKLVELDSRKGVGLNTKTAGVLRAETGGLLPKPTGTITTPGDGTGSLNLDGPGTASSGLLAAAEKRGAVNKYVWGAVGPNSYDCSGLVWRAVQDTYPAFAPKVRFTTWTFTTLMRGHITQVTQPAIGDVVLWREHIGIVNGTDTFYSARNPHSGIGTSKISTWTASDTPRYFRIG